MYNCCFSNDLLLTLGDREIIDMWKVIYYRNNDTLYKHIRGKWNIIVLRTIFLKLVSGGNPTDGLNGSKTLFNLCLSDNLLINSLEPVLGNAIINILI
jgi:hypothetical protein